MKCSIKLLHNMKKFLSLLISSVYLTYSIPSIAQVKVIQGASDTDDDNGKCVAIDASGNMYIGGYFMATVDFDPSAGSANLSTGQPSLNSNQNGFIAKYSSSGTYTWAIKIGNSTSSSQTIVNDITIDGSSNVYVTGQFQGTVDFDPGAGTTSLTSAGSNDIFIAKYNSSSTFQWVKQIGAASSDKGMALDLDASNNIYVTGNFQGTCDFDPSGSTANLTASSVDGFIASYTSTGVYNWAFSLSGTSSEDVLGVTVDATSSNIYVCGTFQKTVDFDPSGSTNSLSSNVPTSGIDIDGFVAKYTCATGAYVWAKKIGGSTATVTSTEQVVSICLDPSDNVYITGQMVTAAVDVNGVTLTKIGSQDTFYAKINSSGTTQWAKNIGTSANTVLSNDIYVEGSNIILCGYFTSTIDFDPDAGTQNGVSAGSTDVFLAEYNTSDGAFICKAVIGGTSIDQAKGLISDGTGTGNFFIIGWYRGASIDLDPSVTTTSYTSGLTGVGSDIFFGKYSTGCGSIVLPIELTSFTAICNQSDVHLQWSTSSETNNDYFTIEKSINGSNWSVIGYVNGGGNANTEHDYSFIDNTPYANTYYFRLSQTNFDGSTNIESIISVECETTVPIIIYANPNPAIEDVNIILSGRDNETQTLYFVDVAGQIIKELQLPMNINNKIDIKDLSNGIYFITTLSNISLPVKFTKTN